MVTQILRIMPLVFEASASTFISPFFSGAIQGEPFRPALDWPPIPFSPLKFSALAQRVSTPSGTEYNPGSPDVEFDDGAWHPGKAEAMIKKTEIRHKLRNREKFFMGVSI
jgi:hypothetical protein